MSSAALVRIQAVSPWQTIFAFDFVSMPTEEVLVASEGAEVGSVFSTVLALK